MAVTTPTPSLAEMWSQYFAAALVARANIPSGKIAKEAAMVADEALREFDHRFVWSNNAWVKR